ncbi:DUF1592 domain-containing protein [Archangium lansingense]|uniref:DUF1592 domain-containing protein n=1 Tax=Archangium lansingense TaxID=2995310 RepID=A0ABT4A347_9BACT|nr:DUF1592 domain-containing protein [Archangium lansinium]MCY1076064.1 DUF1592 domain-containing protein [Archangium lansinium]
MWEPVISVQCVACHKSDGVAAGTRLVLRSSGEPGAVESNFMTVRALAREKVNGQPLLLLKPSGLHPDGHAGGVVMEQGSTRYENFQRFADRINGVAGACEASAVATCEPGKADPSAKRRLRMLTRFEFDNTLRDLLYLESSWGQSLPAEEVVHGFDNNADERAVGQLLTDKLLTAAEQAAEAAMANLSRHVSCAPGDECARQFIQDFGLRAFRRPLTDAEKTRYQTLYTTVAAENGYAEGIEAIIAAMLQSPNFLYRSELGRDLGDGRYVLTDYEVASELSYLFWGSMPDEELFAKAKAGALNKSQQISTEARRMLASPRSRPMLDHFVSLWLDLGHINNAQKDATAFADFSPAIRAAMKAETTELFDYVVRDSSGRLPELFTSDYTFATDALATFYRLPSGPVSSSTSPASGLRMWELKSSGRGGILTHGSILATQATPQTSSPIRRGKLVRERLLCQPLPPPPPGLIVQLSPVSEGLPNRQRFQEHSTSPACSSCHQLMDPIGFGFEQFDSVGRFEPKLPSGQPVDASGEVISSSATNGTFTGVDGLQEKLAESPDVHACFSLQWLRFGYGVSGDDDVCAANQLTETFRKQQLSIPELLISLTQLPRFTLRVGETTGSGDPEPGTGGNPGGGGGGGNPTPTPQPTGNAQVSVSVQDDWGKGYCHNVKVTNAGAAPLVWQVTLEIQGTFNHAWSAVYTHSGNKTTFSGLSWNDELAPGESASFGYCATR